MELKEVVTKLEKSKIKAGDGKKEGKYPLYTCSPTVDKFCDEYLYDTEAIILSTGGNAVVNYYNGKFSYSTDCLVIQSDKNLKCKYMYYYLLSKIDIICKMFRGVGIKHLNKNEFFKLDISIIDKEKQNKIISNLDIVNTIIELKRVQLKEYDNIIKSQFVEMFGDPVFNNLNWNELKMSELGRLERGTSKHRPRNAPELLGGIYPLIQTGDVSNSGLYITEYKSTYSELGLKQSKMWSKDTLCITIDANTAQTSILTFDACFPDSVVGFITNGKVNNILMHYWFEFLQKIIDSQATQVAQKNINLKILNDLDVIVPPIELQNQFSEFVKQIDKQKFESEIELRKIQKNIFYKWGR